MPALKRKTIARKRPSWHLFVQIQQWKHQSNVSRNQALLASDTSSLDTLF